jgi:ABC-2 type transport system permease protein
MKRFWILFVSEFKAWRHDPITALGGFIPSLIILIAFGLLFGGRLTFQIALVNHDSGPYGNTLRNTFDQVLSPFGTPYYDVLDLSEEEAWDTYRAHRVEGLWIIPPDFSERLERGQHPHIEMHFSNYNDDRAKNHRIYSAEILWGFYERIGRPAPPLALAEEYPLPKMIDWFPIISIGVVLMGTMIGGMMNIFVLTYKEQVSRLTLEFGLAPRPLAWVLLPKTLLALLMGLFTGTCLTGILYFWLGIWPGRFLPAILLLSGLVCLFWIGLALLAGMRLHYMAGAIGVVLTGLIAFFTGGGLAMVRHHEDKVSWFSWLFPNTYVVDPMRDMALFHSWPVDWTRALLITAAFALASQIAAWILVGRRMRRTG